MKKVAVLGLAYLTVSALCVADTIIILKKSFINTYHNKALLTAHITPVHLSKVKSAGQGANDGDIHIAAVPDDTIGLPMVAEIANAKMEPQAVAAVKAAAANSTPISVTGVWRLWCEHGGDSTFKQGATVETPETSNPDHVFEMHPLTQVGDTSVSETFTGIEGYTYKDPGEAFPRFENAPSVITDNVKCAGSSGNKCVSIRTRMVGYNYTAFLIKLEQAGASLAANSGDFDSTWVFTHIFDLDGELVVGGHGGPGSSKGKRKMVFVKGTPPYDLLKGAAKGAVLKVVGIPRINLELVKFRLAKMNQDKFPEILRWSLPYEMVILSAEPSDVDVN